MIKKWALLPRGQVMVPVGRVIAAGAQGGEVVCWTDDLDTDGEIAVVTVFTGDDAPDHMDHVDTVLLHDGAIVVHVYCDAGWTKR